MLRADKPIDAEERAVTKFRVSRSANTLMSLLVAAYAWQLHGFFLGLATVIFLWAVRRWTANAITLRYIERTAERGEDPDVTRLLRLTMVSRWAWVIFVLLALAVSAAEVCAGTTCESIWS